MESFAMSGAATPAGLGKRYVKNHRGSQRNPSAPIMAKHACHPIFSAMKMNSGGPKILARLVPEFMIPRPVARSPEGSHSAIAFVQAGKLADSPRPNAVR